jgi:hypothetical protein
MLAQASAGSVGKQAYMPQPKMNSSQEPELDEGILLKLGQRVREYREKYVLQLSGEKNPVYARINPYLVKDSDCEICTLVTNGYDEDFLKIEDVFYQYCGRVALGEVLREDDLNFLQQEYSELENLDSQRRWD